MEDTVTSNLITSLSSVILMEVPTSTPQHARKCSYPERMRVTSLVFGFVWTAWGLLH